MAAIARWLPCRSGVLLLMLLVLPACPLVCRESPCEYTFNVRHARTMIYKPKAEPGKAYKVGLNGTRLQVIETTFLKAPHARLGQFVDDLDDVITADGVSRGIITINNKFPGPTIEVEHGVQVVVKVINWMLTDAITIHWHGMLHKGNLWMDGTALITQCPIPYYESFTYRFEADPPGTHWYHTHNGLQRIDGLFGMLVVHPKNVKVPTAFMLVVADWMHELSVTLETTNPYSQEKGDKGAGEDIHTHITVREYGTDGVETAGIRYQSGLINGRGRYGGNKMPLTRFRVTSGGTYRFRSLNAGAEFSFAVSVDGHLLTVVALDGTDIVPFTVDSVILAPGETLDFEIKAVQPAGLYWLRARTLRDTSFDKVYREVLGVIQYQDSSSTADPVSKPRRCTLGNPCLSLNCPFENYPSTHQRKCVSIAEMRSVADHVASHGLASEAVDIELFLNVGFNWGSSINGRKKLMPSAPLFMKNRRFVDCDEICKDLTQGCVCSANFSIPVGKTIQLVMSNLQYGEPQIAHHPMHLHGHHFAILKVGYGSYDSNGRYLDHTRDIVCDNSICRTPKWNQSAHVKLNLKSPPLKNTIVVPARGYVVVRFKSDNPGRWLFHCHAINHNMEGMTALFMEGGDEDIPPLPKDFPTCYGFDWSAEGYAAYMERSLSSKTTASRKEEIGKDKENDIKRDEDGDREMFEKRSSTGTPGTIEVTKYELVGLAVGCVVLGTLLTVMLACTLHFTRRPLNKVQSHL